MRLVTLDTTTFHPNRYPTRPSFARDIFPFFPFFLLTVESKKKVHARNFTKAAEKPNNNKKMPPPKRERKKKKGSQGWL